VTGRNVFLEVVAGLTRNWTRCIRGRLQTAALRVLANALTCCMLPVDLQRMAGSIGMWVYTYCSPLA
jgi:hypothetical protein